MVVAAAAGEEGAEEAEEEAVPAPVSRRLFPTSDSVAVAVAVATLTRAALATKAALVLFPT